ncbi:type II toxin-antitoxin system RatA family toxin [Arsukibacterium sp.]|uniref:type II toxin-antitoxin system RatA family toxin n=1 Tax=Arsukibacterium sp. TaxID=1977258 RepID=UPI002FDA398D
MPQIERSALVFYSAQQMFELVNKVPAYPEFLPGCSAASIVSQTEQDMVATLQVSKAGISHAFTTRNTMYPYQRIDMQLVDGPFKQLQGGWQFQALGDNACKVILKLDFEFSNRIIQFAFGKIFAELAAAMVNAFTERAKQVYGHPQRE